MTTEELQKENQALKDHLERLEKAFMHLVEDYANLSSYYGQNTGELTDFEQFLENKNALVDKYKKILEEE